MRRGAVAGGWERGRSRRRAARGRTRVGMVSLVGAGPGDPGLLTRRGEACLRAADVVLYDHLVDPRIVALARPGAAVLSVGKRPGRQGLGQDALHRRLVALARAGKAVCRLQGGDPMVFGRGGEEALALARAGVSFEVVPGVTSAVAAAAYAGIPVTHRGVAAAVTVVTGHEAPGKRGGRLGWRELARVPGTLVVLMGARTLPAIAAALLRYGKAASTPAAVVSWGTVPWQRTVTGTLRTIAARAVGLGSPAVVIVGPVVRFRRHLRWFETKPLFGRRVLVTRPAEQAQEFREALEREGAEVVELPAVRIARSPLAPAAARRVVRQVSRCGWLCFTSVNAVRSVVALLAEAGGDLRDLGPARLAAIGPRTAEEVRGCGLRVALVPRVFTQEGLVEAFRRVPLRGVSVGLLGAEGSRGVLAAGLRARGARVVVVPLYGAEDAPLDGAAVARLMGENHLDVVTFTSSSCVRGALPRWPAREAWPPRVRVASIGPVTTAALRAQGCRVDIESLEATIPSLTQAIVAHFAGPGAGGVEHGN